MKAVGLYKYLPITDEEALVDIEVEKPKARGKDILVKVKAISVNPVDTKVRAPKEQIEKEAKILGYDAAGIVEEVGEEVEKFSVGDEVFYAGVINRSGSNAEYQLVDERIVAEKPQSLTFKEAAALPLTTLTASEALFEQMKISCVDKQNSEADSLSPTLLIINGAGGVGSIATQLAKHYTNCTVITTASRPESREWSKKMGADIVINHHGNMVEELQKHDINSIDYIFCCHSTEIHWQAMTTLIKPFGTICSIVDSKEPLNLNLLKPKSASFVWEFMFTKPLQGGPIMEEQGETLSDISILIDAEVFKTTLSTDLGAINAENLKKAHALLENSSTVGKIVLGE